MYNYFKSENNTGFEILSKKQLENVNIKDRYGKEITLQKVSEKKKNEINTNMENFNQLKKEGYELSYNGTNFIVDIQEKLKDGPLVAGYNNREKAYGFFTFYPKNNNIYIYSSKKFPAKIKGIATQEGNFLILHKPSAEDIDALFEKFDINKNSKK
jgi:hypothetical protein